MYDIYIYLGKTSEGSKTVVPDIGGLEWDHVRKPLRSVHYLSKIVSEETAFKGGEHHTIRGSRTDNKERILVMAMARRLGPTEKGQYVSHARER